MSDLAILLDNLIQQAALDADEGREDYSPATNDIRGAIIRQYGGGTADTPAYVGAILRRTWDSLKDLNRPSDFNRGYRVAVRDLAHELGVGLDD